MHPDGCLEYLGRKDLQVKVRGYRFEVTEVEKALLELSTVKEAVVVAREDQDQLGAQRLIAYLVLKQPASSITELRNFLKDKLPDYMVPSAFVFLDELPLGPNGKMNRSALPDPGKSRPNLETAFVAPTTTVEKVLSQICAEVLKLDRVGVHDNFFDLGGHSLLAAQIISKVLETLHVELHVRSFFEAPTVAGLAKLVEAIRWTRQGQRDSIESKENHEQGDL
jgi:acyl carrier protein